MSSNLEAYQIGHFFFNTNDVHGQQISAFSIWEGQVLKYTPRATLLTNF